MYGMKRKTIKRVITKKLNEWLATLPESLSEKVKDHLIVTGGSIASMLLGETINDFDIYCDDLETSAQLAFYYVALFNINRSSTEKTKIPYVKKQTDECGNKRVSVYVKSSGIASEAEGVESYEYFEESADTVGMENYLEQLAEQKEGTKYRPVFLSENAITLSDKIQIVLRFTGSPEEIHKNYDFVHATNYYYTKTNELVLKAAALESLLSKTLIYQGSKYPVCSLFRMRKFMAREWRISAGEITKMAMQISALDLTNIAVLREQLIGVDAAYFHELLAMLTEKKEKEPNKPIEASYVMQLIDELADHLST